MLLRPILTAMSLLVAMSAPVWAGEGNGEPFPPPDSSVAETMGITKPTMGADAPFNYFYTPKPTVVNNYRPTLGGAADPFPYRAAGHVIQTGPGPNPSTHG